MFLRIITFVGSTLALFMISVFVGIICEKITSGDCDCMEISWIFSVLVASMFVTALLF